MLRYQPKPLHICVQGGWVVAVIPSREFYYSYLLSQEDGNMNRAHTICIPDAIASVASMHSVGAALIELLCLETRGHFKVGNEMYHYGPEEDRHYAPGRISCEQLRQMIWEEFGMGRPDERAFNAMFEDACRALECEGLITWITPLVDFELLYALGDDD